MEQQIHPNYIKSSNLIYGAGALGIINIFLSGDSIGILMKIITAAVTLAIVLAIGYFVRQGIEWIKYVLAVLTALGLFGIFGIIGSLMEHPVTGLINLVQIAMQIWAILLLFKVTPVA